MCFLYLSEVAVESGMRKRNREALAAGKRSEPNEARSAKRCALRLNALVCSSGAVVGRGRTGYAKHDALRYSELVRSII